MPGKGYLFGGTNKKCLNYLNKLWKRHKNILKGREQYNNENLLKRKQILKLYQKTTL